MPKAIFLVGLPCSGKSTYLSNRSDLSDYEVLSSDNFIDNKAKEMNKTYDEIFEKTIEEANEHFFSELERCVSEGKNIVIDRTNTNKKSRRKILSKLDGYEREAIYFDIDYDIVDKRLEERSENENKTVPYFVVESMKIMFEEPIKEEGFDKITTITENDQ